MEIEYSDFDLEMEGGEEEPVVESGLGKRSRAHIGEKVCKYCNRIVYDEQVYRNETRTIETCGCFHVAHSQCAASDILLNQSANLPQKCPSCNNCIETWEWRLLLCRDQLTTLLDVQHQQARELVALEEESKRRAKFERQQAREAEEAEVARQAAIL